MKKSIRNLIISSAMLGIGAAFIKTNKDKNHQVNVEKADIDIKVTNLSENREYYKIADIYTDQDNKIKFKKAI